MADWVAGEVVRLRQWTDELYSVYVHARIPGFTAGQFTRLALEIDGEMVARPYSFVNGPDDPLHEFYFILVRGGPLTHAMRALRPGDTLYVAPRAAGFFVLDEVPGADNLWLLSTGTAIGPFLSMLATRAPWVHYRRIVLVHAVRTAAELTHGEIIQAQLAAHTDQLQFVPFVSREQTDFAMPGRVPAAIEDGSLEARTGLTITAHESQVMICGNPDMVRDSMRVLEARGLTKNRRRDPGHITTEQYWK